MGNLKKFFLCGLIVISAAMGCKKSGGDTKVTDGSMSAKINGEAWTAGLAIQAVKAGTVFELAGTGNGWQINFHVIGYSGAKTYALGGAATNMTNVTTTNTGTLEGYSSAMGLGSGQLVISKDDGSTIEGTFSYTAKTTAGKTVTVAEGKFKAKY